jgi:hypothetical protein
MKRKFDTNRLTMVEEKNEYFFEIGNKITTDIAEAVSILMREFSWDDKIWQIEVDKKMIYEEIDPEKSLYWLTGGDKEWSSLKNYNRPWSEYYLDFQEEFGFLIVSIVKRSKTLLDIRNGFLKYLNLPTLYNFAISKNMIN